MTISREEAREIFGLDELPDDEFMQLLADIGEGDVVAGPVVEGDDYTADDLAEEVLVCSVGELLAKARAETGRSLRDVGAAAGVSHGRIQHVEASSNAEVATLVRVAEALGYSVKVTLTPSGARSHEKRQRTLTADLSRWMQNGHDATDGGDVNRA